MRANSSLSGPALCLGLALPNLYPLTMSCNSPPIFPLPNDVAHQAALDQHNIRAPRAVDTLWIPNWQAVLLPFLLAVLTSQPEAQKSARSSSCCPKQAKRLHQRKTKTKRTHRRQTNKSAVESLPGLATRVMPSAFQKQVVQINWPE